MIHEYEFYDQSTCLTRFAEHALLRWLIISLVAFAVGNPPKSRTYFA